MNVVLWVAIGLGISYLAHNYFYTYQKGGFMGDAFLAILGALEGGFLFLSSSGQSPVDFSIFALASSAMGSLFFILLQRAFASFSENPLID